MYLLSMLSCTIKITNGLLEKCFCSSSVFCCPECRDQAAATSHQINCDLNLSAIRWPISHWLIIPLIKLNKIPICFWLIEYLIKKIIGDVNDVNRLLIGWLFPHTIHSKYQYAPDWLIISTHIQFIANTVPIYSRLIDYIHFSLQIPTCSRLIDYFQIQFM